MPTATENAAATVKAIADEEFQAMARGDVASFLGLLAPDVAFFPPNTPPKSGSAVEPWIAEFLADFSVEFQQCQHHETLLGAGWAELRTAFRWKVTPRRGGEAVVRMGNTVRLFRQDESGTWKLAREIWTTYPAT
jgi:ketosteroid isomerase-like protein